MNQLPVWLLDLNKQTNIFYLKIINIKYEPVAGMVTGLKQTNKQTFFI